LRRNLNGGEIKYGDFRAVVSEYRANGFTSITTRNLHYRLSLLDASGSIEMAPEKRPKTSHIFISGQTAVSSISKHNDDDDSDEENYIGGQS
jgi:hypothetical protein